MPFSVNLRWLLNLFVTMAVCKTWLKPISSLHSFQTTVLTAQPVWLVHWHGSLLQLSALSRVESSTLHAALFSTVSHCWACTCSIKRYMPQGKTALCSNLPTPICSPSLQEHILCRRLYRDGDITESHLFSRETSSPLFLLLISFCSPLHCVYTRVGWMGRERGGSVEHWWLVLQCILLGTESSTF